MSPSVTASKDEKAVTGGCGGGHGGGRGGGRGGGHGGGHGGGRGEARVRSCSDGNIYTRGRVGLPSTSSSLVLSNPKSGNKNAEQLKEGAALDLHTVSVVFAFPNMETKLLLVIKICQIQHGKLPTVATPCE